jgi:hypothetical protein
VLGVELTPDQTLFIDDLAHSDNVAVKSGHGTGKSCGVGCAVLWFLYTHYPSIVITTAPTERQVKEILWREIRFRKAQALKPLPGKPLTMKLDLGPRHYALGFSTNDVQQMQGFHCDYVMIVIDEANGFPDELFQAILGLVSGGTRVLLVRIGNPIEPIGHFFNAFTDPDVSKHTMSCLNHPNVLTGKNIIPGAVTKSWVDKMLRLWGKDSAFWDSRVLGNFPRVATDIVVNLPWVEQAEQEKPRRGKDDELFMGYDSAEYGNDEHVWYIGTRTVRVHVEVQRNIEPSAGAGVTKRLQRQFSIPEKNITIDGTGAGAVMYSFLKLDLPDVRRFVARETALNDKEFEDKQSEAYWHIRNMLNPESDIFDRYSFNGKVDKVKADICSRKYISSPGKGRIMLEPKPKFRDRLLRSPNWGDAMMLCYSPLVSGVDFGLFVLPNVIGAS